MKTSTLQPADRQRGRGDTPAAIAATHPLAQPAAQALHGSPRQAAQRRQLTGAFGPAFAATVQRVSAVRLAGLKLEARTKHDLMERIAKGVQLHRADKLGLYDAKEPAVRKTVKVNMALAGRSQQRTAEQTIRALAPGDIDAAALRAVIAELATMPAVDADSIDAGAIDVFSCYTKEGYENVTGVARGGKKFDKALGHDRKMSDKETAQGSQTLNALVANWAAMPKFTGSTVYRVVHAGTGEDALAVGASLVKPNPTSTSVALDWSRVGPGKVCCKIVLKAGKDDQRAVDTRAVSTYTHEGEILLTPGTTFTKVGVKGDYTEFEAQLP